MPTNRDMDKDTAQIYHGILLSHKKEQNWVISRGMDGPFSSVSQSYPTLCNPMDCSTPGLPVHHQLRELAQTQVHQVGDAIQPSFSVIPFSSCLQSFSASGSFPLSQFFASGGQSINPSNEYSGLISFRIDWSDLLAVQGTLKSPLQHHSSKTSILWQSAFFMIQLSHPYMTIRKTIALTRRTFVGKVMFLLSNMLSWLVIAFLPRSKHLLISWLQSTSAVILEPKTMKSASVLFCFILFSYCFSIYLP